MEVFFIIIRLIFSYAYDLLVFGIQQTFSRTQCMHARIMKKKSLS